jgi:hypothetical protein
MGKEKGNQSNITAKGKTNTIEKKKGIKYSIDTIHIFPSGISSKIYLLGFSPNHSLTLLSLFRWFLLTSIRKCMIKPLTKCPREMYAAVNLTSYNPSRNFVN